LATTSLATAGTGTLDGETLRVIGCSEASRNGSTIVVATDGLGVTIFAATSGVVVGGGVAVEGNVRAIDFVRVDSNTFSKDRSRRRLAGVSVFTSGVFGRASRSSGLSSLAMLVVLDGTVSFRLLCISARSRSIWESNPGTKVESAFRRVAVCTRSAVRELGRVSDVLVDAGEETGDVFSRRVAVIGFDGFVLMLVVESRNGSSGPSDLVSDFLRTRAENTRPGAEVHLRATPFKPRAAEPSAASRFPAT
jgi:hypothetical protein